MRGDSNPHMHELETSVIEVGQYLERLAKIDEPITYADMIRKFPDFPLREFASRFAKSLPSIVSSAISTQNRLYKELHLCDGPMTSATSRADRVRSHGTEVAC
jgi:hypothetical protein